MRDDTIGIVVEADCQSHGHIAPNGACAPQKYKKKASFFPNRGRTWRPFSKQTCRYSVPAIANHRERGRVRPASHRSASRERHLTNFIAPGIVGYVSLRGVKRRSNLSFGGSRDCVAALAMTVFRHEKQGDLDHIHVAINYRITCSERWNR